MIPIQLRVPDLSDLVRVVGDLQIDVAAHSNTLAGNRNNFAVRRHTWVAWPPQGHGRLSSTSLRRRERRRCRCFPVLSGSCPMTIVLFFVVGLITVAFAAAAAKSPARHT